MVTLASIETLNLRSGQEMEDIILQLQPYTSDILTVKDGTDLYIFKSRLDIPPNLEWEASDGNKHFHRSTQDESLYCFFIGDVHTWLLQGRKSVQILDAVDESSEQVEVQLNCEI